jgi:hypothetical protein
MDAPGGTAKGLRHRVEGDIECFQLRAALNAFRRRPTCFQAQADISRLRARPRSFLGARVVVVGLPLLAAGFRV